MSIVGSMLVGDSMSACFLFSAIRILFIEVRERNGLRLLAIYSRHCALLY